MRIRFTLSVLLLALGAWHGAPAAEWKVRPETSSVRMFATKQGSTFGGVFEAFTAKIEFDAAMPEDGTIVGVVQTASIETEDAQNNAYILGYLEVEAFPEARFESTAIRRTPEGYRADGELTLKGITKPAALDFTFEPDPGSSRPASAAKITGSLTINRLDYDIATELDTIQAGRDVLVYVELDLRR